MANYRITYWKDIPSHIEAVDGSERVRRPLSDRFQELVDAAAMQRGLFGSEAYLEGWRVGPVVAREGSPKEVAEAVAAEIEATFEDIRTAALGTTARGAREQEG